ncbi:hypothetical protein ACP4OV_010391 [Aristida adscensionis]
MTAALVRAAAPRSSAGRGAPSSTCRALLLPYHALLPHAAHGVFFHYIDYHGPHRLLAGGGDPRRRHESFLPNGRRARHQSGRRPLHGLC